MSALSKLRQMRDEILARILRSNGKGNLNPFSPDPTPSSRTKKVAKRWDDGSTILKRLDVWNTK